MFFLLVIIKKIANQCNSFGKQLVRCINKGNAANSFFYFFTYSKKIFIFIHRF